MNFGPWLRSHRAAQPYRKALKLAADMPKEVRVRLREEINHLAALAHQGWCMSRIKVRVVTHPVTRGSVAAEGKEVRL